MRGHRIPTPEQPAQVSPVQAVTGGMSPLEMAVMIALLVLSAILIILALRAVVHRLRKAPPAGQAPENQPPAANHEEQRQDHDETT